MALPPVVPAPVRPLLYISIGEGGRPVLLLIYVAGGKSSLLLRWILNSSPVIIMTCILQFTITASSIRRLAGLLTCLRNANI